ncbi:sodium:alanine symporter family protein [Caproiciproducens sp. NJN-50]|uniref:alanine/glycine:cation symporter family protein n=1 Tax=Caproiciproducens sp. NJN-50 TaxID=2507162 RepID=UPI000FFE09AB|nr:sodium:alanine symporter family protein [Caproiciproducens sp. NJN-50]QAT48683.1 sodium:alanine symporter family protein [Caproiciproducens sp. NJN-50]
MDSFVKAILSANSWLNGIVWGIPTLILLIGTGLYLSIRTGFIQFRKFGYIMRNTFGRIFQKQERNKGSVTPFQAVSTALASTVGTGNIAGVTGAIALGGPGAVFWMWVAACVGMVTKYSEVTLAVKYRERNKEGDWVGGPMYYITNGLGKNWKWLAVVFSILGSLTAIGTGNITQSNTIAISINTAIQSFHPDAKGSSSTISIVIGIILAVIVGLVVIGGISRIGAFAEKLVPFMAIIYILAALVVVFGHINYLGLVLAAICKGAFSPSGVMGGAFGVTIVQSVKYGAGRGIFSNEAGLGTAPIAHAATSETNPVKQGMYGVFEVFVDTIVICSLTAFAVLSSSVSKDASGAVTWSIPWGSKVGSDLTATAFATVFGNQAASVIIAIGLILFATTTIVGWALYGARCCEYLFGSKSIPIYRVIYVLMVFFGSTMDLSVVWDISDTLNGLMMIPNLIALLGLSGVVIKMTKAHFSVKES